MKKKKEFAACVHTLLYLKTCSFRHSNRDILYSTVCHLNLCMKNGGHRARLGENDLLFL